MSFTQLSTLSSNTTSSQELLIEKFLRGTKLLVSSHFERLLQILEEKVISLANWLEKWSIHSIQCRMFVPGLLMHAAGNCKLGNKYGELSLPQVLVGTQPTKPQWW